MAPKTQIGLNKAVYLVPHVLDRAKVPTAPTRNGYGTGIVEAGKENSQVVVLCADLTESTRNLDFKNMFPERFVQMGVSEQSMASIAAGMSLVGKIPFIASYAAFSPGRNWEQIRTTIALQHSNVKIMGAHAGISVGPDGATHQMIEDLAITRVIPNMQVIVPCDANETHKATLEAARFDGPVYMRFGREKTPVFTTHRTPFEIGRIETFRFGTDATIVATGYGIYEALLAADSLAKDGYQIEVLNCHTIKPFDYKALVASVKKTGCVVTVEEAQAVGGLGGVVAEALGSYLPAPLERVGIQNRFGESGDADILMDGFGLTAPHITEAVKHVLKRKQGKRVPDEPAYVREARMHLSDLRAESMKKALAHVPKKWKS